MNIAFVARSERNPLNSLYLQHIVNVSPGLIGAGYQVMVVMDKGDLLKDTDFPGGVELVEIEFQNSPWRDRYLSEAQAVSDQFLLAVSAINATNHLDIIEFPLWGGLGFSTIRCKRLLGYCKPTRIVTNAIFSHSLLEELNSQFFPTGESEIVSEMEAYILRYSDLICSPFEIVGQRLRTKLGRSDIKYYDSTRISKTLDADESQDASLTALKNLVSQGSNQYAPMSVEKIFHEPGRRHYNKKDSKALISILVPYRPELADDSIQEKFAGMGADELEILYFCPSEEGEVKTAYEAFSPEYGRKYEPKSADFDLFDVLNACKGIFLMIFSDCFDVNIAYVRTAISSLLNNPELAYVGAYLGGGIRYPVAYVPALMPLINTCALFGNVFRKRSLEACLKGNDFSVGATIEWDLLNLIHQRYQSGDIIPHTFCQLNGEIENPAFEAATRLRSAMEQKQFSATVSARILKLLASSPELLAVKGSQKVSSEPWEYSVPVCKDITEEMSIPSASEEEEAPDSDEEPSNAFVEVSADDGAMDEPSSPELLPEDPSDETFEDLKIAESITEDEESVSMEDGSDFEEVVEEEPESDPQRIDFESILDAEIGESEVVEEESESDDTEKISFDEDSFSDDDTEAEEESQEESPGSDMTVLSESPESEEDEEEQPETASGETTADDEPDWFQVFWAKDGEFIEKDSITEPYHEGNSLYLEFAIQAARDVNMIRLDPCNRPGVVSIRKIEVRDNESGLIVFSASEDNAFDNIVPSGDFEVNGIEQDALILKSTGMDPQLIIHVKHTIVRNFTLTMKYDYQRSD